MTAITASLIAGPVNVPEKVLAAYHHNYGSADLDPDYLNLYNDCEKKLQTILGTQNSVIMQTGEGMLGLWGALKSCIRPGDQVVAVCTGVFGYGIADMAETIGAKVRRFELPFNSTVDDCSKLEKIVAACKPKMITAVHCETPSGTLNPLHGIARIKKAQKVPLLCVDSVASAGGMPVEADKNSIDLCLNGSQKCLSAPPDMTFVAISETAWEIIDQVNYAGYDAFKPFRHAQKNFYFPNTMYWHGLAGLSAAAGLLLSEGLAAVFDRHIQAQSYCISRIEHMGLELFPANEACKSPSVTAVKIPPGITWEELDRRCRSRGLAVAGSYGLLAGKVFRIGHMGSQADLKLLEHGLNILESVL
ncbi:MAG TPA: aminotransferase class V-fold PLP-dependent enzyme [Candidatus Rifleibacterium sp.]|nr:aminotransferase class V-fold PLP-dependent enzyme [Candidatus Rifleibacterium sp.]HPT46036.1 aminotransferase class V-fold PLP-dependent enzyme [Candidatus Rifleibacterium sp.]